MLFPHQKRRLKLWSLEAPYFSPFLLNGIIRVIKKIESDEKEYSMHRRVKKFMCNFNQNNLKRQTERLRPTDR
jgi:hypothetical protein